MMAVLFVYLLIAFIIVGYRFVKAYIGHNALYQTVPQAHIVTQGETVFREGQRYFPKEGTLVWDLTEDVFTFRNKVIIWKPDVENFVPYSYLRPDGVKAKLKEILVAMPKADLKKYSRSLGIVIVEADAAELEVRAIVIGKDSAGVEVELPYAGRPANVYVPGIPGTGKTTLLLNMIRQDIENGAGVTFLDPHNAVAKLLPYIPGARQNDVILFDKDHLWGINLFDFKTSDEKERLEKDVIATFSRLSSDLGNWGIGMDNLTRQCIRALVQAHLPFTDAFILVTSDGFRRDVIKQLRDPQVKDFWENRFKSTPTNVKDAVANRLDLFVSNDRLRYVFSTPDRVLDFQDIFVRRQVLLVQLSDDDSSKIIGSVVLSKHQQTALRQEENFAVPRFVFIDEFQRFTTNDFLFLYTEMRKYKLCLVVANQGPKDLKDEETQRAVAKSQYYIVMRQDHKNAGDFHGVLGEFDANTLLNLQDFEAIFRDRLPKNSIRIWTLGLPERRNEYRIPPPTDISPTPPPSPPAPPTSEDDDFRPTPKR